MAHRHETLERALRPMGPVVNLALTRCRTFTNVESSRDIATHEEPELTSSMSETINKVAVQTPDKQPKYSSMMNI